MGSAAKPCHLMSIAMSSNISARCVKIKRRQKVTMPDVTIFQSMDIRQLTSLLQSTSGLGCQRLLEKILRHQ